MKTVLITATLCLPIFMYGQSLFTPKTSIDTGVDFENQITETADFNFFHFDYFYNGGGVAVGDINNDGLQDLYFVGNQVQDRLYLNKGNLNFEDITIDSGIESSQSAWHTGVSMVDINNDGWLDIYVCRSGSADQTENLRNLVYINQKDNTFKELGKELGLDDGGRSVQVAFLDYDKDGDLDVFVANHYRNVSFLTTNFETQNSTNSLYKNEGGVFKNVSLEAEVSEGGFSIGVVVSDLNNDGWPDIYVANDFIIPDFVYINQKDGTFKNELEERFGHIPTFSMGVDAADVNNDLLPDVYVADMASEDHVRSKRNMGAMDTKAFWENVKRGGYYQFMFNCLQLSTKSGVFQEIAQLAHVAKTDWSWAPLLADFNNDGWKDLFVSNGIFRDVRNNDYNIAFDQKYIEGNEDFNAIEELDKIPQTPIANYIFKNNGDLTFTKKIEDWGLNFKVNSNGAVYADLDNDGDLEIILNNVNEEAIILENNLTNANYIQVRLYESELNPFGVGAKVVLTTTSGKQMVEVNPSRGFQSSVPPVCYFGFPIEEDVVSVKVNWNNGEASTYKNLTNNSNVLLKNEQSRFKMIKDKVEAPPLLTKLEEVFFQHKENEFDDFEREVLLPHKMSQLGPFLNKADVNGDGLYDVYVGGAKGQSGTLLLQTESGFIKSELRPWEAYAEMEEMGSAFFDLDGDKDLDLIVFSGGNEDHLAKSVIYLNNGKGEFSVSPFQLSESINSQKIIVYDINEDGWDDLIVGGRQVPGVYPSAPKSAIFMNEKGVLINKIKEIAPELEHLGMITDIMLFDYDGDRYDDILVVGEWMGVSCFKNNKGRFSQDTLNFSKPSTVGWWNAIYSFDIDNDGEEEILLGNIGANNKYHPSQSNPLHVFFDDFDQNGTKDIVLAKHQKEIFYPVRGRQCTSQQMPNILKEFPSYDEFSVASLDEIYSQNKLNASLHIEAREFKNGYMKKVNDSWEFIPFLNELQVSPINAFVELDINDNGENELLLVGNRYEAEVETARYDAGIGAVLSVKRNGFEMLDAIETGFLINKNAKSMLVVNDYIFIGCNNDELIVFKVNK